MPTKATSTQGGRGAKFDAIKARATAAAEALRDRDAEFDKYLKMYLLSPDSSLGKTSRTKTQLLYDPGPHNTVNRIVEMYTVNEPSIRVPTPATQAVGTGLSEQELEERKKARLGADKAERFLKALLYRMKDVTQRDSAAALLKQFTLFDEASIIVDNVLADEADPECPFLFDVPLSKLCYPVYSRRRGLLHHTVKLEVSAADLLATYGDRASFLQGREDPSLTLYDYVDRELHAVWVDEHAETPVIFAPHELKFIPRVSMIASGSDYFQEEKDKRVPFLFSLLKAGVWAARNLQLTLMHDNTKRYLLAPIICKTRDGQPKGIPFDGTMAELPMYPDEDAHQLVKNAIPPEQLQLVNLLWQMAEESSLSRIVGGFEGSGAPAAAISMLTASSRLATRQIADAVNRAMSRALSIVLEWICAKGEEVSVWGADGLESVAPSDLTFGEGKFYSHVEYRLQPDMQQERQMIAGLVSQLFGARLIGYDLAHEMLERGTIIPSAAAAMDDLLERAILEAQLPVFAQQSAKAAQTLAGKVQAIPSAPRAPGAEPAAAPPGTLPGPVPTQEQVLGAMEEGRP